MATKIMARKYTDGYYYIWENGKRIAHSAYDEESAKSEAKRRRTIQAKKDATNNNEQSIKYNIERCSIVPLHSRNED